MRALIARRYRNQRSEWLDGDKAQWPFEIPLGSPSEADVAKDIRAIEAWVSEWRTWPGPGEITWIEKRWRTLGTQSLPERLVIRSPEEAAACIGELHRWNTALSRYTEIIGRRFSCRTKLSRNFDLLADSPAIELERIEKVLDWLADHSAGEIYARQLPIAGIDTKWLENRAGIIADLWGAPIEFRRAPFTIRTRILDPGLRATTGGLSDISAPVEQLANLKIKPSRVWIVENIQTGLAFDALPGSVLFMGLGYGVSVLSSIPWVQNAECFYWGDLDTHGFAILNRARSAIPGLHSVLMDEATLLRHRDMWVHEAAPCGIDDAPLLTPDERRLFQALHQNRWGTRIRLEQERIPWDYAWSAIS